MFRKDISDLSPVCWVQLDKHRSRSQEVPSSHPRHSYRPHPKDVEGTVFTGVCLSTPVGGTPSLSHGTSTGPMSFPGGTPSHNNCTGPMALLGVPSDWSQVVSGGTQWLDPGPFWGYSSSRWGYPSPRWRYPSPRQYPRTGLGTPSQDRMGYYPARTELGTPSQDRIGYPQPELDG